MTSARKAPAVPLAGPGAATVGFGDPVAAAAALVPQIAVRAREIEAARRLPADLAASLAEAGLFALCLPRDLGGHEASPLVLIDVCRRIARADASVAWCVMIAATTAINGAYLPLEMARTIWSRPTVITGGVFAPKGTATSDGDDYVVSGRWAWGSGSANCQWLAGGALVRDGDAPPTARMMWFPRAEVELIDTWDVLGLRGTGSGDFAVSQVRVPRARSVSLTADRPRVDAPLYRFPAFGLLALGIAGVAIGIAEAAIDDLIELAGGKVPSGARRPLAERPHTQLVLAEAAGTVHAARAGLEAATGQAYARAAAGDALTLADRAQLRIAAALAARQSAVAVRQIHDLAGGSSVYHGHPLERRFRDAHTATQHVMASTAALELAGRALLGLDMDFSQL